MTANLSDARDPVKILMQQLPIGSVLKQLKHFNVREMAIAPLFPACGCTFDRRIFNPIGLLNVLRSQGCPEHVIWIAPFRSTQEDFQTVGHELGHLVLETIPGQTRQSLFSPNRPWTESMCDKFSEAWLRQVKVRELHELLQNVRTKLCLYL